MGLMEKARSGAARIARRVRADGRPSDAGWGIAEVIVAMAIFAVISTAVIGALKVANGITRDQGNRSAANSEISDVNGQLSRDVEDATSITTADRQRLVLTVIRDDTCWRRSYTVDAPARTFKVQTDYYAARACSGSFESRTQVLLHDLVVSDAAFTYRNSDGRILSTPVQSRQGIATVAWVTPALPKGASVAISRGTAAAFNGRTQNGDRVRELVAQAPLLSVVTAVVGVDKPVLKWTDLSPELTGSWTVWRSEALEGGGAAVATWTPVAAGLPASTTSWTDTGAKDGFTDLYAVQATLTSGTNGPSSNQVVSGLRPVAPTGLTATGGPTTIQLGWTRSIGEAAVDVYRDGKLLASLGNVTSYVDATGYGHSHMYAVVAVNGFEALWTTGLRTSRVAVGTALTATYNGGKTRYASTAAAAFTAPAAPSLTATPSTTANSVSLAWTPAAFTGAGGHPAATLSATWDSQKHASTTSTFVALKTSTPNATKSVTDSSPVKGDTTSYQARTCNASGCSPWSATKSAITVPPAATCTVSGLTTRAAAVKGSVSMTSAATSWNLAGGKAPSGYTVSGIGTATTGTWAVDRLADATKQPFTVKVRNATGWGPTSTCAGTTKTLATPTVTIGTRTTSSIAMTCTASNGNAADSSVGLTGETTATGTRSHKFTGLQDNRAFTAKCTNGDGVNTSSATKATSTPELVAPAATCKASVSGQDLTVSGGDQVRLGTTGTIHTAASYTYSDLDPGSYTAYVRNTASDGTNTSYSTWDPCPSKTITVPKPAAPGCSDNPWVTTTGVQVQSGATFCTSKYAVWYVYQYQWTNSEDGSLSPWADTSVRLDAAGSPYDSAGKVLSLGPDWLDLLAGSVQYRIYAASSQGASAWSYSSVGTVPHLG